MGHEAPVEGLVVVAVDWSVTDGVKLRQRGSGSALDTLNRCQPSAMHLYSHSFEPKYR